MAKRGSLGIDVGGTKTLFALFDEEFNVVEEIKVKSQAEKGEKHFTDTLTQSVEALLKKAEKKGLTVFCVGVGCAGSIDMEKGVIKSSHHLPFLKNYPLRSTLAKITGANVYLANDVQAGLYGEHRLGAAVGKRHVIGIFIGTGINGALILDGKPFLGATGHAGDIGHYLLQPMGPLAGSERQGVLDDVASRTAIAGQAATLAAKQWAPNLAKNAGTDIARIKSGDLAEAIAKGDKSIEELVRGRAHTVGIALSNIVDFLNPEMIVLGGGLVEALPELVREEIEAGIKRHATPEALKGLKVVVAKLKDHAGTTGAARLAFDTFLAEQKTLAPSPVAA
jgi:glucokinase